MNVLKLLAPMALCAAVSACTTVEYIPVTPSCSPVVMPALPDIDRGYLWDTFVEAERFRAADDPVTQGDEQYRLLESYVDGLWSVIDEQAAIIGEVCGGQED